MGEKHKFQTLDALRGVAAIIVVVHHNNSLFNWRPHHGYLAVDLFFSLSGFVLSYAYQSRLDEGLPTWVFLKSRLIRLAPLYLLALVLGWVVCAGWGLNLPLHLTWQQQLLYPILGVFLIPVYSPGHPSVPLFPYNGPSWTLLLEVFINVVHGLCLRRVAKKALMVMVGVSGLVLAFSVLHSRTQNTGWTSTTLLSNGIPRVFFSYLFGMLIFRTWSEGKLVVRVPSSCLLCITVLALVVPTPHEAMVALLMTIFLLPAIVYAGAFNEPGTLLRRTCGILGVASYAIYVLHFSVSIALKQAWRASVAFEPWSGYLLLVGLIALSLPVDAFYDVPVRQLLRRRA